MRKLRAACIPALLLPSLAMCSPLRATPLETGIASVYSDEPTANGEYAHQTSFTAAHRTLALDTWVEVLNLDTRLSVVVRINDRGPYIRGRIIDLTPAGAKAIGSSGLARVTVTPVGNLETNSEKPPASQAVSRLKRHLSRKLRYSSPMTVSACLDDRVLGTPFGAPRTCGPQTINCEPAKRTVGTRRRCLTS